MQNGFDTQAFVAAYMAGNQAAKDSGGNMGLFQLADAAGYERESMAWRAFVGGGAAYVFKGHDMSELQAALQA